MDKPLWIPNPKHTVNTHLSQFISSLKPLSFANYSQLHQWSVQEPEVFWKAVANFCNIHFTKSATHIRKTNPKMQNTKWFLDATLNFSNNLLHQNDEQPAIISYTEQGHYQTLSFQSCQQIVSAIANYLAELGVQPGDRVAGFMANIPETVLAMLASTRIGAIWTSCSPDFGLQGLSDRFGQIEPKILFAVTHHQYAGKLHSHVNLLKAIIMQLPSLKACVLISHLEQHTESTYANTNTITFTNLLNKYKTKKPLENIVLPFEHPAYILYSSGTTGKPKCMVHGAGNTLIQHKKELMLHCDIHPNDRVFFYTTCGWMMWNWLVSSLSIGATLVLYDGSPTYPKIDVLLDLADQIGITHFGIGAKIIEYYEAKKLAVNQTHSLKNCRCIFTTGSPLLPSSFDYVYQNIKSDVQLSSISGGSDIVSCFALGNPLLPVYRGELQCIGLGMDVQVYNEKGHAVLQEKGELVCCTPFPAMPLYFWNDKNGEKYQHAYFDKYPNIWAHGDYAEITVHHGMIIYGRSDATLNPGGVRIGTAEIYQQLSAFPEIIEGLAIGRTTTTGEEIVLFVVMQPKMKLESHLIEAIKKRIKQNLSPHHVPKHIIKAPELPRTVSGKIMELAVKKIVEGKSLDNTTALANPKCLEFFKRFSLDNDHKHNAQ